jgi:hypothetical protein
MTSPLSPKDEAFTRLMCFAPKASSNENPKGDTVSDDRKIFSLPWAACADRSKEGYAER